MSEAKTTPPVFEWQSIETAPRDGSEILVLIDCATVAIVRVAWWLDKKSTDAESGEGAYEMLGYKKEDEGWWSYRHSVTQEKLEGHEKPIAWMDFPNTDKFI